MRARARGAMGAGWRSRWPPPPRRALVWLLWWLQAASLPASASAASAWLAALALLLAAGAAGVVGHLLARRRLEAALHDARSHARTLGQMLDGWQWQTDAAHRLVRWQPPHGAPASSWAGRRGGAADLGALRRRRRHAARAARVAGTAGRPAGAAAGRSCARRRGALVAERHAVHRCAGPIRWLCGHRPAAGRRAGAAGGRGQGRRRPHGRRACVVQLHRVARPARPAARGGGLHAHRARRTTAACSTASATTTSSACSRRRRACTT